MLNFIWRRAKPMLGVDFSATTVKVLELSQTRTGFQVDGYGVAALPTGVIVEKTIKDPERLSEGLCQALERCGVQTDLACTAVPDSSVINKTLQLSAELSDNELYEQVLLEAEKYIPYPLEEVRLDYEVIGPNAENPHVIDVLLVAVRADLVNIRVQVFEAAGLALKVVDVESFAVERATSLLANALPEAGKDKTVAVFDIGATMTNLTVLHDHRRIFTREEVFGGQRLTQEIMQRYDMSFSEAGRAKKTGELPDDYESDVLAPFRETAVLQVRRALQFFFSNSQHAQVNQLLLAGGSAQLPGLDALIEAQLSIPTIKVDPFEQMAIAKRVDLEWLANDAPSLLICCGLAMRGLMP